MKTAFSIKGLFFLLFLFISVPGYTDQNASNISPHHGFFPIDILNFEADESLREPHIILRVFLMRIPKTQDGYLRSFLNIKEGQRFSTFSGLVQALEMEKQRLIDRHYYTHVEYILEGNTRNGYIVTFLVEEEISFDAAPISANKRERDTGKKALEEEEQESRWIVSIYAQFNTSGVNQWEISQTMRKVKIGSRIYEFFLSQLHKEIYIKESGIVYADYSIDETCTGFSTDIHLGNNAYLRLSPGVTSRYNYSGLEGSDYILNPLVFSCGNAFCYEDMNGKINTRDGYRSEIFADVHFANTGESSPDWEFYTTAGISASYYRRLLPDVSVYSNITLDHSFLKNLPMKGDLLRGVPDEKLFGNKGIYFRNTIGFDVLRSPEPLNIQIHPFFDIGTSSSKGRGFRSFHAGAGTDILFFLNSSKDFIIRTSIGFDVRQLILDGYTDRTEITFQTGLAY